MALLRGEAVDLDPEDISELRRWLGRWDPEGFSLQAQRAQFDLL